LSLEDADGREVWTDDEIGLVEEVSEQVALALENARLFQETQEMAQRRALINEVLQAASTSLEPENLLHKAAEAISARLQIPSVVFMLDEGTLRLVAAHDHKGEDVHWEGGAAVAPEMDPTLFEAVRTKEVRLLDAINGRLRGPAADLADQLDIASSIYAPLISRGQVLGVLQMGRMADQPALVAEDVTFAEIIAGNLSVGLESARLYQEAVDTAERLREVDRLKSQFLANMSHELRTPLNSIIGFSRVILKGIDGPVTDQQQEDLEAIHNSGQHLLGLINDILDISKIEAGKMELSFGEVDLEGVIEGVMSTAIALVKDKPVDLQHSVADDLPTIKADERRVRQVLLNLVSNSAKFTEEGFIRVEAELDAAEEQAIVSVIDTGSGIPQEKIEEIFQPFTQVDGSSTRKHGGTGLGLAITNSFVEMHGGELWVESEVGEGSTFYFSLPVEGPSAPEEEEDQAEEKQVIDATLEEEGKLVLCVDDDEGVLTLFRRYLRKQGYQIVGLTDSSRVLQEAKRLRPYAITLDVMMPEKDGWEVIRDLKEDPETRDIPVIVCSIVSDKEKGMTLGAADYLVKPIVEDDLIAALDRLDREEGIHRVLVVDDNEEDRDLLRRMIEAQEDYVVVEAEGGQEAINLIKQSPPHIIILDLMMPEVDGFAVLEVVKTDQSTRHIPVVVVTAKELTAEERQILNHRIDSLIQKGVLEQEALLEDVTAALHRLGR
jgi:signal transduction histidine kinase/CheY-like chemotaxis protein